MKDILLPTCISHMCLVSKPTLHSPLCCSVSMNHSSLELCSIKIKHKVSSLKPKAMSPLTGRDEQSDPSRNYLISVLLGVTVVGFIHPQQQSQRAVASCLWWEHNRKVPAAPWLDASQRLTRDGELKIWQRRGDLTRGMASADHKRLGLALRLYGGLCRSSPFPTRSTPEHTAGLLT